MSHHQMFDPSVAYFGAQSSLDDETHDEYDFSQNFENIPTNYDDIDFDNMDNELLQFQQDEVVQEALLRSVDLTGYYKHIQGQLADVEADCVQDYISQAEMLADLYTQMKVCDKTLNKMQDMLVSFQCDLAVASDKIHDLQAQSMSVGIKLTNRKYVDKHLSSFLSQVYLSPDLVNIVMRSDGVVDSSDGPDIAFTEACLSVFKRIILFNTYHHIISNNITRIAEVLVLANLPFLNNLSNSPLPSSSSSLPTPDAEKSRQSLLVKMLTRELRAALRQRITIRCFTDIAQVLRQLHHKCLNRVMKGLYKLILDMKKPRVDIRERQEVMLKLRNSYLFLMAHRPIDVNPVPMPPISFNPLHSPRSKSSLPSSMSTVTSSVSSMSSSVKTGVKASVKATSDVVKQTGRITTKVTGDVVRKTGDVMMATGRATGRAANKMMKTMVSWGKDKPEDEEGDYNLDYSFGEEDEREGGEGGSGGIDIEQFAHLSDDVVTEYVLTMSSTYRLLFSSYLHSLSKLCEVPRVSETDVIGVPPSDPKGKSKSSLLSLSSLSFMYGKSTSAAPPKSEEELLRPFVVRQREAMLASTAVNAGVTYKCNVGLKCDIEKGEKGEKAVGGVSSEGDGDCEGDAHIAHVMNSTTNTNSNMQSVVVLVGGDDSKRALLPFDRLFASSLIILVDTIVHEHHFISQFFAPTSTSTSTTSASTSTSPSTSVTSSPITSPTSSTESSSPKSKQSMLGNLLDLFNTNDGDSDDSNYLTALAAIRNFKHTQQQDDSNPSTAIYEPNPSSTLSTREEQMAKDESDGIFTYVLQQISQLVYESKMAATTVSAVNSTMTTDYLISQIFQQVWNAYYTMLFNHVDACHDSLELLCLIRIIELNTCKLHAHNITAMDSFLTKYSVVLWNRFKTTCDAHALSLHNLISPSDTKLAATSSLQAHPITIRYVEFVSSMRRLNSAQEQEIVSLTCLKLLNEVRYVLDMVGDKLQFKELKQIFLINNYDVIVKTLIAKGLYPGNRCDCPVDEEAAAAAASVGVGLDGSSYELETFQPLLASLCSLHIDNIVANEFKKLVEFVKEVEPLLASATERKETLTLGMTVNGVVLTDDRVQYIVTSFNSLWKKTMANLYSTTIDTFNSAASLMRRSSSLFSITAMANTGPTNTSSNTNSNAPLKTGAYSHHTLYPPPLCLDDIPAHLHPLTKPINVELAKRLLLQIALYYKRFVDVLTTLCGRRQPLFMRELVSVQTVMMEVKKHTQ